MNDTESAVSLRRSLHDDLCATRRQPRHLPRRRARFSIEIKVSPSTSTARPTPPRPRRSRPRRAPRRSPRTGASCTICVLLGRDAERGMLVRDPRQQLLWRVVGSGSSCKAANRGNSARECLLLLALLLVAPVEQVTFEFGVRGEHLSVEQRSDLADRCADSRQGGCDDLLRLCRQHCQVLYLVLFDGLLIAAVHPGESKQHVLGGCSDEIFDSQLIQGCVERILSAAQCAPQPTAESQRTGIRSVAFDDFAIATVILEAAHQPSDLRRAAEFGNGQPPPRPRRASMTPSSASRVITLVMCI